MVLTEPKILSFEMTQKGQSATKEFKIFGRFEGFKVSRATTPDSETFGVEVIDGGKVEKDGEELWLQIVRVTILESARPDNHRTEITVRTNEEKISLFSLAVVGRVIGDLQLTPVRLTMGGWSLGMSLNERSRSDPRAALALRSSRSTRPMWCSMLSTRRALWILRSGMNG